MADARILPETDSGKSMKSILPAEALAQHIGILGKTGSGKTTTAKGLAEGLLNSGKRLCALDPTGVWWGLRLLADGKSAGYPVVIFGGSHADVAIDDTSGVRLAEIIASGSFSCVIDTSMMTVRGRTKLFTDFAEALFRANSRPLHLIIDEAHVFMPQGKVPNPQSGEMVHAANNLVSGGRSRGLRIMLISQRPAKVHKDSLTQVETLIAMRLIAPQDRDAVEAWIGEWDDSRRGGEIIKSLPSLARGEGWVWSPEVGMLERVAFPQIKTFDSSRAPEDGESVSAPPDLASVNIDAIRSELAIEVGKPEKQKASVSKADVEAAEKRGHERGYGEGFVDGRQGGLGDAVAAIYGLSGHADNLHKPVAVGPRVVDGAPESEAAKPKTSRMPEKTKAAVTPINHVAAQVTSAGISKSQQRILDAMARLESLGLSVFHKTQVAAFAGVSPSSSGYTNNLGRLRAMGLIDYPQGGFVAFAESGRKLASLPARKPTLKDSHEAWLSIVTTAQQLILREIIAIYPEALPKSELALRIGVSGQSSGYTNNLGRLRTLGAIDYPRPGQVRASDVLFPKRKAA